MLSSLACELVFNDARDSGRRHSKSEKTCAHNLHCVAHKSTTKRPAGGAPLHLENSDWQNPLPASNIRSRVHSALKATDADLGINSDQLTKNKTGIYTKPHVMSQRLELLAMLSKIYQDNMKDELTSREDRMEVLDHTFKDAWASKLIPSHYFVTWDEHANSSTRKIVLSSGPFLVRVLELELYEGQIYTPRSDAISVQKLWPGSLLEVSVARTEPSLAHDQIAWRQTSDFMSLPRLLADDPDMLLSTARTLISSICTALKLRHSKMDYRARLALFLNHMGKDPEFIASVLDEVPEKECKAKHETRIDVRTYFFSFFFLKFSPTK